MTTIAARRTRRPNIAELAREIADVATDLPLFLTAPLYRRRHLRWGATAAEFAAALPGDELQSPAQFECTRAVTVDAPPEAIWPWLVQVGCLKGGFYSNDLLDNLAHPSAREIIAEFQHLEVGQWVSMSPTPTETTALRVHSFAVDRWLLWRKPDSTWVWTLTDIGHGRTRVVTRVRAFYDWKKPLGALFGVLLMEFGDFAMMRGMLLGIKERAESRRH